MTTQQIENITNALHRITLRPETATPSLIRAIVEAETGKRPAGTLIDRACAKIVSVIREGNVTTDRAETYWAKYLSVAADMEATK